MSVLGYSVMMRFAGGWEPPPAMFRSIGHWVAEVYASHVLALVDERLDYLSEGQQAARGPSQLAEYRQTGPAAIRALKPGKRIRFKSPSDSGDFLVDHDPPSEREVNYSSDREMALNEWRPGEGKGTRIDWEARRPIEDALRWFDRWLERQERQSKNRAQDAVRRKPVSPERLVELQLVKRECLKYATVAKKRSNKVEEYFDVDVRGWKYLTPAEQSPAFLKAALGRSFALIGDRVKVTIYFRSQHDEWNGLWSADGKISIDAPAGDLKIVPTLAVFHERINSMLGTTYHELQHAGQDLLKLIRKLPEHGGLPSRSVRNPELDLHGVPLAIKEKRVQEQKKKIRWKKYPDARVDHPLRDVEFHTNLGNDIRDLRQKLTKVPPALHAAYFKFFVGEDKQFSKPDKSPTGWTVPLPSARMWLLRKEAPEKWELLVRALTKAVDL